MVDMDRCRVYIYHDNAIHIKYIKYIQHYSYLSFWDTDSFHVASLKGTIQGVIRGLIRGFKQ